MKTKPVGIFENTQLGVILKSKFGVILSNWLFQGMRFMNRYEIMIKILLDTILLLIILQFIELTILNFLFSVLLAHTINWVVNGHFFVLMRYVRPFPKRESDFEIFIEKFKSIAMKFECVDSVAIYGSYCRQCLNENSDLDVRVVVKKGIVAGFCGALFCMFSRFRALLSTFPLDVFCCVEDAGLEKLRDDEIPVILFDRSGFVTDFYNKK